jgi:oligosaccharide repeat unit polymerase
MPIDGSQLMAVDVLFLITGLLCLGAFFWAWHRFHDPFHPAIVVCPLLFVAYVWTPLSGVRDESIFGLLSVEQLSVVLSTNALFIAAYLTGCLWFSVGKGHRRMLTPIARQQVFLNLQRQRIEIIVAVAAVYAHIGYWIGIRNAGGFAAAYGSAKGGGAVSSGYLGDAPLAAYPAFLLFGLSRHGKRLTLTDVLIGLVILAPNLIQGTLGARRGPLFITIITMVVGYFFAQGRRPSVKAMVIATSIAAGAVVFIGAQRSVIYYGSQEKFDFSKIFSSMEEEHAGTGGTFTVGAGSILTGIETDKYYWGRRYLVIYLIRPIPRQFFEDKESVYSWAMAGGATDTDFVETMHWIPLRGSATGFVADLFAEFSWFGVVAAFFYGALPGMVWRRAFTEGGIWLVELGLALTLMVYVPSQSVSAFLQRFLFAGVSIWVAWRWAVGKEWDRWQRTVVAEASSHERTADSSDPNAQNRQSHKGNQMHQE